MKDITNYAAAKYEDSDRYQAIEDGIYLCIDTRAENHNEYVTSLSFVQEPDLDEGDNPREISQYPIEDVLDRFMVSVSDFFDDVNADSEERCHMEFAALTLEEVSALRSIIGKHVYNVEDGGAVDLLIEG